MAVKAKYQITLSAVVDVYAVYRYYKLQASTLAAPSKPTVRPPSGWSDTEPSYTSGSTNTLYTVDCNVFSDGTFAYSAVSKSSSYEAAKEAWNKAANAAKTASDYMQYTADGLEVGNKSSGSWSGFRSRMAAGAFEVLDAAGNVLSSFGASVVELGKNSVNSIIKLCGGKGEVSYGTIDIYGSYYGALRIASEAIVNVEGSELVCRGDRVHVGNVKSTPSDPAQYCGLQVTPNGSAIVSGYAATIGSATKVYLSSDKNLPVQINGNDMVDFVVAQGTSGIWRWRKWASGFAECWGVTSFAVATGTDNWHWLGYDTTLRGGHALPFRIPKVYDAGVDLEDPVGGAFWAGIKQVTGDNAPTFFVLSASGYSRTVWAHYHVTGTWR